VSSLVHYLVDVLRPSYGFATNPHPIPNLSISEQRKGQKSQRLYMVDRGHSARRLRRDLPGPLRCSRIKIRNFPFLEVSRSGALF
jgi:hypothetical protein